MASQQQKLPTLPSILTSIPALQDNDSTVEQINTTVGRATSPSETAIVICTLNKCFRLFPSRERLLVHRKRDHNSDDAQSNVITWNDG